jgi:hypothetical protein
MRVPTAIEGSRAFAAEVTPCAVGIFARLSAGLQRFELVRTGTRECVVG